MSDETVEIPTLDEGGETPIPVEDDNREDNGKPKVRNTRKRPKPPARSVRTSTKGRKAIIEWDTPYTEFVEGILKPGGKEDDRWFPTLKDIAERHGLNYNTVRQRSSDERWREKKDAYQLKVTRERQAERARRLAKNAAEFDEKAYDLAKVGMALVQVRLLEITKEANARRALHDQALRELQQGLTVDKERLWSAVRSRELEGLASAAERFQSIGMKSIGTDVQKHEISGPGGGPIENQVNITAEITRDDAERTTAIIASLFDAEILPKELQAVLLAEDTDDEDIQDAEIVDDEESS